jgi:hypothetical protein
VSLVALIERINGKPITPHQTNLVGGTSIPVLTKEQQMHLTPVQVAQKLGITRPRVHTLIRQGVLVDVKPHDPSKKKHFPLVDSRQLADYIKTNGRPHSTRFTFSGRNARVPQERIDVPPTKAPAPVPSVGPGILTRLEERLDRLETKVDTLLRMWT